MTVAQRVLGSAIEAVKRDHERERLLARLVRMGHEHHVRLRLAVEPRAIRAAHDPRLRPVRILAEHERPGELLGVGGELAYPGEIDTPAASASDTVSISAARLSRLASGADEARIAGSCARSATTRSWSGPSYASGSLRALAAGAFADRQRELALPRPERRRRQRERRSLAAHGGERKRASGELEPRPAALDAERGAVRELGRSAGREPAELRLERHREASLDGGRRALEVHQLARGARISRRAGREAELGDWPAVAAAHAEPEPRGRLARLLEQDL